MYVNRQSAGKDLNMCFKELLAKNARCGDGSYWRHPECVNYKLIFSGTNRSWLTYKAGLVGRSPKVRRAANSKGNGVYGNAKTLWEFTTFVDEVYTEYKSMDKKTLLSTFDFDDFLMWFIDDGTTVIRRDHRMVSTSYKYVLSIGNFLHDLPGGSDAFLAHISSVFPGKTPGSVCKNNSKATSKNMVWNMPNRIGQVLVSQAIRLPLIGLDNKFRSTVQDQTSEIIPQGSSLPGLR
jgi:hypothetical protein